MRSPALFFTGRVPHDIAEVAHERLAALRGAPPPGQTPTPGRPGDDATDGAPAAPATDANEPVAPRPVTLDPPASGSEQADDSGDGEARLGPFARLRAGIADHVPVGLRGGRLALDGRAVLALGLVGVLAVALGVSYLLRARPQGETVPVAAPRATVLSSPHPSAPQSAGPSPSGAVGRVVLVHVAGKVRRPGVVRLRAGSRVVDAIQAAGGLAKGGDTTSINLARVVGDGEQVLVGGPVPVGAAGVPGVRRGGADATSGPEARLDLNTATPEQLEELPGVGPVLASRIIEWRGRHGPFRSVDELREVSGIGERRFEDLKDRVRA